MPSIWTPGQGKEGGGGGRKLPFFLLQTYILVEIIHVLFYYRVNPDILSPVGDRLPGNGRGSRNHTCI